MKKILVLLANGFEEGEMIIPVDVLRRARFQVDLMSIGSQEVISSHGIKVAADRLWNEDTSYDAILLPGGSPGTAHLLEDERVLALIRRYDHDEKHIFAICAAPSVLAKAGILKGRHVTSYPLENLDTIFTMAHYHLDDVVIDQKLITSRGVGTAFQFAYACANALGADVSTLKRIMMYSGT